VARPVWPYQLASAAGPAASAALPSRPQTNHSSAAPCLIAVALAGRSSEASVVGSFGESAASLADVQVAAFPSRPWRSAGRRRPRSRHPCCLSELNCWDNGRAREYRTTCVVGVEIGSYPDHGEMLSSGQFFLTIKSSCAPHYRKIHVLVVIVPISGLPTPR
jgi:hypothetical protein